MYQICIKQFSGLNAELENLLLEKSNGLSSNSIFSGRHDMKINMEANANTL